MAFTHILLLPNPRISVLNMSILSNFGACSSLDELDISAVEYARLNGLARNHLTDLSSSAILHPVQKAIDTGIIDDSHLEQLKCPEDCCICERLTISKDGAQLLAWAMHPESRDLIEDIVKSILGSSKFKMMRVELPLLRSDHETDIREFASREEFETQLKDVRLPLEKLNMEKSEGLEFSPSLWNLGARTVQEIKIEKIIVIRESLEYIQRSIWPDWTEIDEKELWEGVATYKKVSDHDFVDFIVLRRVVDLRMLRKLCFNQ